jgi:ABC-2 type transport system permease protein
MPAFLRRYLAQLVKEVDQLRRNRVLLVQLMLPPTIVLVILGYAMNPKVRDLRMGIVDESFAIEGRDFIDSLTENVNFDVTRQYIGVEEAEEALKSLDQDLFIVIPTDFARTLQRDHTADVQLVIDAVDANTAQIAQGSLSMPLQEYNSGRSGRIGTPVGDLRCQAVLANATHPAPPPGVPEVQPAYLYNLGLVASWHYVTGLMSIIMFIKVSLVASALAVK